MSATIAVVIPTRNRPEEAKLALTSLVAQSPRPDIYLCDNSALDEPLRSFCKGLPGVTYLRPETELAMGLNWDWGLREAMRLSPASHFNVHYDRKVSKPEAWSLLASAATRFPDTVLSFPIDHVGHVPPPLRLWQGPWTGKMYRISLPELAVSISQGLTSEIAPALPILSNCVVPRRILNAMIDRFGTVCDGVGPDTVFLARLMTLEPDYIHVDQTFGVLHTSVRSNGLGYMRNKGGDFKDFMDLMHVPYLDAAPIPGLSLGFNMLYHEYEMVRRETGDALPQLERAAIMHDISKGLLWIEEPELVAEYSAILRREGWVGQAPEPYVPYSPQSARYQRNTVWRMRLSRYRPPNICGFTFRNDAQAIKWALRHPRQPEAEPDHLAKLNMVEVGPVALGTGAA